MPNGTDLFTVTPEGKRAAFLQYQIPEGVPVLIFAGQQNLKKNPDSVLRACALLKAQGQKTFLIMVGTGPDLGKIKALARELSLERDVLFTGFISDRELLMALYERADLMVFPSLYDNAPMVVREAAVMGTPALLIEGSCSAEGVVHGQNGYLCDQHPGGDRRGHRAGASHRAGRGPAGQGNHPDSVGPADAYGGSPLPYSD